MTQDVQYTPGHDPDHLQMVERLISNEIEFPSMREFWEALPRRIPYREFEGILARLDDANKIMIDKDGSVMWIYIDSPELQRLHDISVRVR